MHGGWEVKPVGGSSHKEALLQLGLQSQRDGGNVAGSVYEPAKQFGVEYGNEEP